jgi:fatty acid synthase
MTSSFLASLSSPYALVFAGQGSSWQDALTSALTFPGAANRIRAAWTNANRIIQPVSLDLITRSPYALHRLNSIVEDEAGHDPRDRDAAISVPGIALAQLGALVDLEGTSLDVTAQQPTAILGHSQGLLGAAIAKALVAGDADKAERILALAILIGHAATAVTHAKGVNPHADLTPMLSIRGIDLDQIAATDVKINQPAVVNGPRAGVYSGDPDDLAKLRDAVQKIADDFNTALDAGEFGGTRLAPKFDFLPVAAPFHSELLAEALDLTMTWVAKINQAAGHVAENEAGRAGSDGEVTLDDSAAFYGSATRTTAQIIDEDEARELASRILVDADDWVSELKNAREAGVKWFLDLGPTPMVTRLSRELLAGTGSAMLDASSAQQRTNLDTPGFEVDEPVSWDDFAPELVELPDGRTVVETAFTRLTGRSPIMLPGMTPTTVSPEIVAAAANGGYWSELAGGGQYSEEVFTENRIGLENLLEPGRTAGFNAMFFDRFMWNLQFGVNKIVPKARVNGAPFDSVTIAAGIPELDEAHDLIRELSRDGFTNISFKPGTIDQINQVLDIADANPEFQLIIQVEDGHAGGHHSWENLDDLLLATYARIRATENIVLAVGGGIGTPERAADYMTGRWALPYGRPLMPVDAVMIGTAAMAVKEARTSPQVKQLLKDTPGVTENGGWVGRSKSAGGITSGLSHLDADMHEIDNSSARASRLIHQLGGDLEKINARRDEVIAALDKTAKPYFGDVDQMTYAQWATRVVDMTYPSTDWTWDDRVLDLFHRIEARLTDVDHGEIETLFEDREAIADMPDALERLLSEYPIAHSKQVTPSDAKWFIQLCRKHHKPMPFVPALDADLARWWGTDTLWQSHDERFDADSVRVIPGPISVAGIDRVDEPVADMFARYEAHVADSIDAQPRKVFSRFRGAQTAEEFLRATPHMVWAGNLVDNPAHVMPSQTSIVEDEAGVTIRIDCDTAWDELENPPFAVRRIDIPILVPNSCATGGYPVVDLARLSHTAYDLLAGAAGVSTTTVNGDHITEMPSKVDGEGFGTVHGHFTFSDALGNAHAAVTGGVLDANLANIVPDALVGPSWPTIYAALGTAIYNDIPVIEGLVNAVHLDQTITLTGDYPQPGSRVETKGYCESLEESSAGRVVTVRVSLFDQGREFAKLTERFAIRGRVTTTTPPQPAPAFADVEVIDTPRSVLRNVKVQAPHDMTAFANVSGDYNPIHTSYAAARLSGLKAPLVHGMWLSAVAQHTISATNINGVNAPEQLGRIRGSKVPPMVITAWSYQMYGMVDLNDEVEITVERVGRVAGGDIVVEATCRIAGNVVSTGRALIAAPKTAYVYPGQGIQRAKMGMENMTSVTREIWARADKHTRDALGFSIEAIVAENPTELRIGDEVLRHPEGVLNLTQFTQVALATLAYAQTAQLKADDAFVDGSYYAGHSLGEYNALAATANIFPLEQVLEIVYQRGSAMHHLVERDANGRSNYQMGALRPNQFGVGHEDVRSYIDEVAAASGEFLEIVNYNLAGSQYAVAGTIAGIEALAADSAARAEAAGGKRPFMLIPGIDVPFHSSVLRPGVPAFRQKLLELLPQDLDWGVLVNRYVPNLVARPFEMTREFAQSILDVVPSEAVRALVDDWDAAMADQTATARTLLVELLAWQFASPVRWIETQDLLFAGAPEGVGIERLLEVGLASSPTLANLASRTLSLPHLSGRDVEVLNSERDAARVLSEDVATPPVSSTDEGEAASGSGDAAAAGSGAGSAGTAGAAGSGAGSGSGTAGAGGAESGAGSAESANSGSTASNGAGSNAAPAAPAPSAPVAPAGGVSGADAPDVPVKASDAVRILLAFANKMTTDQVDGGDTVETLTNGVSSKRNQLLMDIAAELSVSTIEGAGEASVDQLLQTVDGAAGNYKAFGPVLSAAITSRERALFGGAGMKPGDVDTRVSSTWGLGPGWVARVHAALLLGTREGESVRGGTLATLPTAVTSRADAEALIDAAVTQIGEEVGVAVALSSGGAAGSGEMVDSAALSELKEEIFGENGVLASQAREMLNRLGLVENEGSAPADDSELLAALDAELGTGWADSVKPAFDPRKAVLLDDRWASAREDLARAFAGEELSRDRVLGGGQDLADLANWYANHSDRADYFKDLASAALENAPDAFGDDVALVTGAAPGSIATSVAAKLLQQGATVIQTASRISDARLAFAKKLYRENAAHGAKLWLVPANLASFRDVDALIDWIATEQTETVGATTTVTKPALLPTLFFPFAAPPVHGMMGSNPHDAIAQERLLVWSVERAINQLSQVGSSTAIDHRVHVVLPGSPNRGTFGGDGAYGESKAAFDAIVNKWHSERGWTDRITLAHPRIGWVQGTNLMGGNDVLVPAAQAAGIHVFTPEEITDALFDLVSKQARTRAIEAPLDADLTGGLSDIDLPALAAQARSSAVIDEGVAAQTHRIQALPNLHTPQLAERLDWTPGSARLDEQVVIVGLGEVGTWGSRRTRNDAEVGEDLELTAAGVMEMAWMMGLIEWKESPDIGWYDSEGNPIDEADIYDRYANEVLARSGVRELNDDSTIVGQGSDDAATMYLPQDQQFTVESEEDAQAYVDADPTHTHVWFDGEWHVLKKAGAAIRVPRRAALSRFVGGQVPQDFDPAKWGIPATMIEAVDRIAIWNLVTAVDAFISAGFSPAELLRAVHPAEVSSTQGTGIGGMESLRKVFLSRFLGEERQQDILQEALPNVVAAHTMQAYVGGYGQMIHPVGACATAAVSVEEGVDKIRLGKSTLVVAGGIDDIGVESLAGFGDMNATADTQAMLDKGISPRHISRAGDRRRSGFLEAEGGGTVLLARGDVAADLGLPVYGVVAFAQSFADGAHTSIPAPGLGALAAGRGRDSSALARGLRNVGASADDVAVVSKHDTSTNANDPNEAELHSRLTRALGRTIGNPLYVISQKTLTGHAKGGAALFQIAGLCEVFANQVIPGNRSLDCLDPVMKPHTPLVWLRKPLRLTQPARAAVLTSLGFGHVAALIALVHPSAFEATLAAERGEDAAATWRERANQRLADGARRLRDAMTGGKPLFQPIEGRRLPADSDVAHEVEAEMLLDTDARLGSDGKFSAANVGDAGNPTASAGTAGSGGAAGSAGTRNAGQEA